jgi:phage protein D
MAVVRLSDASLEQGGFYAPRFEIKIAGAGLKRDILRDVTQLTYQDNIKEIDSFELTVNNWDAGARVFKYIGAETQALLDSQTDDRSKLYRLFQPSTNEIEVRMGYLDELRVMMTGHVTTMEPTFTSSGPPTLTVRGLNLLHQLRRKPYSTEFRNKTDSEIARELGTLTDPDTGQRRFPLPIEVDSNAAGDEPRIDYVAQDNQHDIDFLLLRARMRGYVVFVQEKDRHVRGSKRRLYFGPSHGGRIPGLRDITYELKWGASLLEFKPTLSTAVQVRKVTVVGWNRQTRTQIRETVSVNDAQFTRNRDLLALLPTSQEREDVEVREPMFTQQQARARATAILMDKLKELVKVQATTVGLPDLRAGKLVRIIGVGSRLSGTYFITDTTHTINDGGYVTKFGARREDDGSGAS